MNQGENSNIEASEVELSTDDLMQLSSVAKPSTSVVPHHVRSSQAKPRQKSTAAARSDVSRPRSGLYVIGAIVAIIAGAAVFYASQRATPNSELRHALRWTPLPSQDPEPIEEPARATQELKPVRIRNAFDRSEVFEFPPGTSQQEAREAVAQILLQRAAERQTPR